MFGTSIDVGANTVVGQLPAADAATIVGGSDGYDAINPRGRRGSASGRVRPEDSILTQSKRTKAISNANDLFRNFVLAGWAIRRHLDYVTMFDFHASSPDEVWNEEIERLMAAYSTPELCDIGGRHDLDSFGRLSETGLVLHGDSGLLKIASDRGYLQGIESNDIRQPDRSNHDLTSWVSGVKLGRGRRAVAYNIVSRDRHGKRIDKDVRARDLIFHAAFENRYDQVRGISSFITTLNEMRDLYETFDDVRARIKVEQLFALALTRQADSNEKLGDGFGEFTDEGDDVDDDVVEEQRDRGIDFGNGPQVLDLDTGEKAEFLTSSTPGNSTIQFLSMSIACALKSLDLPFCFFDESHTNFFGSRSAWIGYERACRPKRKRQKRIRDKYSEFRLSRFLLNGDISLPSGWTFHDALRYMESIPQGVPWWKPSEELDSELRAAGAGLMDLEKIAHAHNLGSVRDNIRKNAALAKFAEKEGWPLTLQKNGGPITMIADAVADELAGRDDDTETNTGAADDDA